jgi:putative DNA primase/helicase
MEKIFMSNPASKKIELKADELFGAELLDKLTAQILEYVVIKKHEARAIALWIVHTHVLDCSAISPRLKVQSPEPECGKTTLLDILRYLARNPMLTAHATAAAVYHAIADNTPTLLIDEADTCLTTGELIAILNAGHRRNDAEVVRAGSRYSVWAPVAFATINGVQNQLDTRSISINLRRRRPDEVVKPFQHDRTKSLRRLNGRVAKWAKENREALKKAKPDIPEALHNRLADNWRPLLAIADVAGGEWPKLARRASEALSASEAPPESEGVMLLSDIRDILTSRGNDRVWSNDLATALAALEGRPWCEHKGHGAITANAIALLLQPYGIKPADIRKQEVVSKGYRAKQFNDAFARYLPKKAA